MIRGLFSIRCYETNMLFETSMSSNELTFRRIDQEARLIVVFFLYGLLCLCYVFVVGHNYTCYLKKLVQRYKKYLIYANFPMKSVIICNFAFCICLFCLLHLPILSVVLCLLRPDLIRSIFLLIF